MTQAEIEAIIERYERKRSAILAILQDIQERKKYLPREILEYIGEKLHIPLNKLYRIATFYRAFSLTPRGRHEVCVCMGTACHVRGAQRVLDQIKLELAIAPGETTKDLNFTLETVNCLGVCAAGPVVAIDGQYFGKMTPMKVEGTLRKFRANEKREGVDAKA